MIAINLESIKLETKITYISSSPMIETPKPSLPRLKNTTEAEACNSKAMGLTRREQLFKINTEPAKENKAAANREETSTSASLLLPNVNVCRHERPHKAENQNSVYQYSSLTGITLIPNVQRFKSAIETETCKSNSKPINGMKKIAGKLGCDGLTCVL